MKRKKEQRRTLILVNSRLTQGIQDFKLQYSCIFLDEGSHHDGSYLISMSAADYELQHLQEG